MTHLANGCPIDMFVGRSEKRQSLLRQELPGAAQGE